MGTKSSKDSFTISGQPRVANDGAKRSKSKEKAIKLNPKIRKVCVHLIEDSRNVDYILKFFLNRHETQADEKALVNDPYEAQGMNLRTEEQYKSANYAARKLEFVKAKDNTEVGEFLQWINYQAFPPNTMHEYPSHLEGMVAKVKQFDGEIEKVVAEINRDIRKFK
ncbi:uncharacterized protein LOC135483575 [Lineus longissimus]|uniref:uncharacterized protein LOC135483575 n=1 Tax=Lineus longissimus TaxID=88925 RepID=UPI002B4D3DCD